MLEAALVPRKLASHFRFFTFVFHFMRDPDPNPAPETKPERIPNLIPPRHKVAAPFQNTSINYRMFYYGPLILP
jgi:hypothetical protein